ncbi:hypothetical protein [Burkholderia ubonensis]|uniref:hypothetical protein n=1 Tax=Burkholderia ubonensis TaxID=101571 RepID=UPI0008FE2A4E|nr:hypothetical protein [Burkholderia ubonensis]
MIVRRYLHAKPDSPQMDGHCPSSPPDSSRSSLSFWASKSVDGGGIATPATLNVDAREPG